MKCGRLCILFTLENFVSEKCLENKESKYSESCIIGFAKHLQVSTGIMRESWS